MLIHKKAVKQYALEIAAQRFPTAERTAYRSGQKVRVNEPRFIQVGADFFIYIEGHLKEKIRNYIQTMPTVGRTIK